MPVLDLLAEDLGVSGRTLRRAAERGTIRCDRPGPRRIAVSASEYRYARSHWPVLARMLATLRTLPNVRLAVLYGSVARGEEADESDVDVLVELRSDDLPARADLRARLRAATGRDVQLVGIGEAERSPLLLADVLRDGRVLIDRDNAWAELKRHARDLDRRARAEDRRLDEEAWSALDGLAAG
jgi:predicted nucleotidyltransferase